MINGFLRRSLKAVGRHNYIPDPSDKEKFPLTQKIEELVKQILELRKIGKTTDAEFLERKIDEMVETLYGVNV